MKPLLCLCAAAVLAFGPVRPAAASGLPSSNVAWQTAAADADIDRVFALAQRENKPLLLYWGATWCPPCNQLKATLFNRADFAAESRSFIVVHVDGDGRGAQKLGRRFNVSGYPTLVLFKPDGSEITRLPGEVDPEQVLSLMQLGMSGGRPVKAVLADARAGKPLGGAEWRMLAFYSWDTDEGQLLPKAEVAGTLVELAAACPPAEAETKTRLWLKAIAASDEGQGVKADAALRERVLKVLADPAQTRAEMDVIGNSAADMVRVLAAEDDDPARPALVAAFDGALQRLAVDPTLSRADRLGALISRIDLARLGVPKDALKVDLPEALRKDLREQVARDDREITDAYERQAVIPSAAYALGQAGLWPESDALLKANLAKSPAPYYLMSELGSNARKLGHKEEALSWYRQAWEKSSGPATRLQWGAGYLSALVDLAPADSAAIEKTADRLFAEAGQDSAAFDGRSVHALQRVGNKLVSWQGGARKTQVLARLQTRLDGLCAKVGTEDGQRASCQALLKTKKAA